MATQYFIVSTVTNQQRKDYAQRHYQTRLSIPRVIFGRVDERIQEYDLATDARRQIPEAYQAFHPRYLLERRGRSRLAESEGGRVMLSISSRSKLYAMPETIKKELIKKTLSAETVPAIAKWLNSQSMPMPEKQLYRLTKQIKDRYGRLIMLSMPIQSLIDNLGLIELKGVKAVEAELIKRLEAKNNGMFAFLDNTKETTA